MRFTVKVGKEDVLVKIPVADLMVVYWKGVESFISAAGKDGKLVWKQSRDNLDDKILQRIGKAIEKYLKEHK